MDFTVKDSGLRQEFSGGMQRDVTDTKIRYDLIWLPGLERLSRHLTLGAKKYDAHNWLKAEGQIEMDRFKESADRHFFQWKRGDNDEDHMAAVVFNLFGAEYVRQKLEAKGISYVWDYFKLDTKETK